MSELLGDPGPTRLIRESLRGAVDVETLDSGLVPLRLPRRVRPQFGSDWVRIATEQASGVRCEFQTAATWIELTVQITGVVLPWVPDGERVATFSAVVDGEVVADVDARVGSRVHLGEPAGTRRVEGEATVIRFELGGDGSRPRPVTLWMPHTDTVEIRDSRADAVLEPMPISAQPRWWHHGSSVSQCIEAATPLGVWPVAASRALGVDVTNLGFAANAHLDPFVARAMRDSGADLLSFKIGINIVGGDTMKRRTFIPAVHGFLDTIREGAPSTPILVISPIFCPFHEDLPGPTLRDPVSGEAQGSAVPPPGIDGPPLTLRSVRDILRGIVAQRSDSDSALFYLDGLDLFGEDDVDELPDGLHPSPAGYLRMADRFAASPAVVDWMTDAR